MLSRELIANREHSYHKQFITNNARSYSNAKFAFHSILIVKPVHNLWFRMEVILNLFLKDCLVQLR